MNKLVFYFKVTETDKDIEPYYLEIELNSDDLVDVEQYKRLHQGVLNMIAKRVNVPASCFEKITKKEYDMNVDTEVSEEELK